MFKGSCNLESCEQDGQFAFDKICNGRNVKNTLYRLHEAYVCKYRSVNMDPTQVTRDRKSDVFAVKLYSTELPLFFY